MVACAVALGLSALAGPVTLSYQGRLTSSSGEAVADGDYSATFSLWDDPTAGNEVWSEVQSVHTTDGLFATELGSVSSFFDIFTEYADRDLYLQVAVQVGGSLQVMGPRSHLSSSPYARSSSSLHALHASPPQMARCVVVATDSGAVSTLDNDSDGDGVPEFRCVDLSSSSSSSSACVADLDGDGLADRRVSSSCDESSAVVTAVADHASGGAGRVVLVAGQEGASSSVAVDTDGDGKADRRIDQDCDDLDASLSLSCPGELSGTKSVVCSSSPLSSSISSVADLDGDGRPDLVVTGDCDDTDASVSVSSSSEFSSRSVVCSSSSSSSSMSSRADLDGDGIPDLLVGGDCDDEDASLRVSSSSSSSLHSAVCSSSSSSSSLELTADLDNDGTADRSLLHRCADGSCRSSLSFTDGPTGMVTGVDDDCDGFQASSVVTHRDPPSGQATGKRTVSSVCGPTTSSVSCDVDIDDDGISEGSVSSSADDLEARCVVSSRDHSSGQATGRRSHSTVCGPTTSSTACAVDFDGDGVSECVVSSSASSSSGVDGGGAIAIDEAGVHCSLSSRGWDGTIKGRLSLTDGPDQRVDFDSDGDGFVATRFGIGVLEPAHPFEHSSGAHLTAGGVFTNASDEHLKENFQPVDGVELLEKIEELPISQWNYKNEPDDVTHIGPTAQDFKAAFGVGTNDKTISTIDPAGIALAAIKELLQENRELKNEVEALKKAVAELNSKK